MSLNIPKENQLHIAWYKDKQSGMKVFTIYCDCGDNRFLVAKDGVRCYGCHKFNTHMSWLKANAKVDHQKRMADVGALKYVPRNIVDNWEKRKKLELGIII